MLLLVLFVCFVVLVVAILICEAHELGEPTYLDVLEDMWDER